MSRLTLTNADKQARDWFVETTQSLSCKVTIDAMGKKNILVLFRHLSQPVQEISLPFVPAGKMGLRPSLARTLTHK
jgi:hypothetical protein